MESKSNGSARSKIIENYGEKGEKGEKAKGLRHFSQKVCEKVKSKGVTTYNEVCSPPVLSRSFSLSPLKIEVADELVHDMNEAGELGKVDSVRSLAFLPFSFVLFSLSLQ